MNRSCRPVAFQASASGPVLSPPRFSRAASPRALTAAVLLAIASTSGCGQPELKRDGYFVAVSLDQAFERRDAAQLARADDLIAEELASGKITSQEADALSDLVALAEQGDWQRARTETRKLLSAQSDW